ncbi:GNAT family N-acetyltransferase [Streptomyces stramineus]|uniref:GNAT family N-acetyltransferase n=1 Tax=Streptomyces stramineus TaxID=173861 RepID=A0ABN1A0I1_9ACTN
MSVELRHHTDVEAARQDLLSIYTDVHADETSDFYSAARFADRLRGHAGPGWEAVIAYDAGEPAGFAYGTPLGATTAWWEDMLTPLPDGYAVETGRRTLAFNELKIRSRWRGKGLGRRLHDELLSGRSEERVTLLVNPQRPRVVTLYQAWGYEEVGRQQPFPDSPVFACMTRPMRLPEQ